MFFIIFLYKRNKFLFHFFSYSFLWILKYYFSWISKPPCSRSKKYLFKPVISHLIFPACLTKKCASFDINFGRWPTAADSLLINAIAYLSWTKIAGRLHVWLIKLKRLKHPKYIHEYSNSQQKQIIVLGKFLLLINISLAIVLTPSLYTL